MLEMIRNNNRDESLTEQLKNIKLKAKNRGNKSSAVISAAYYARKHGISSYVYYGNSYGVAVYRASLKESEYLCAVNNCGAEIIEVTPSGEIFRHKVKR